MKRTLANILAVAIVCVSLHAQERSGQTEKKEPEARRIELPATPTNAPQQPPLPKIDLPEYIITGIAALTVPNVHKEGALETARGVDLRAYHAFVGARERETVELENRQKESLHASSSLMNGQAMASVGNYFTPRVEFWVGQTTPDYDYRVQAGYHRTKGYVRNSDRSGGNLGVNGGVLFGPGAMEGARLGGDLSFGSENYRFFGSNTPTSKRTLSNYGLAVSLTPSSTGGLRLKPYLGYRYDTITDSSAQTRQHRATLGVDAEMPFESVSLFGSLRYDNASMLGAHAGHPTMVQARVGTTRYWWDGFFVKGAAQFYAAKSMAGQKLTRIYPDVSIGYYVDNKHLASLSYAGSIEFVDLATKAGMNPYLSAGSVFRHTDRSRQIGLAVESDWTEDVRTKFNVSYQYVNDYGLYIDPLGTGIGTLNYAGKTTLWQYQAEGFAKLTPNDYVSGKVSVNSTDNSVTALAIPYIPEFEVGGSYTHWFPYNIGVSPSVSYTGRRETGSVVSQQLPGYFLFGVRAEYEPVIPLSVFIDLHNITNKKYELWKGYQAPPFMITGGVSFRW